MGSEVASRRMRRTILCSAGGCRRRGSGDTISYVSRVILVALAALGVTTSAFDLEATLAGVSRQVEQYYSRARAVLCTEHVRLQPLRYDYTPEDRGRDLVYELRVEWDPPMPGETEGDAHVVRRLLTVNGRAPRPQDEPGCTDPKPVSPEPLAIFLPARRRQYVFSFAGTTRSRGRDAVLLDYRDAEARPPSIEWKDDCVTVDVPAKTRGRAWIDAATGDVLRLDERFSGLFDIPVPVKKQRAGSPASMTIERSDTSIEYRPVTFTDPDETLLLPWSIQTFSIVRNAGTPRLRTTQTFSNYKRFVTGSRIVQ
jgi:hypothetical protein